MFTVKFGCVVPSYSMLSEQFVREHYPILHHSSWGMGHHVQTLVLGSPKSWSFCATCSCAVFGQASYTVFLMAVKPMAKQPGWWEHLSLLVLCAQIRHWSQVVESSCVLPEFKSYPQAVLCVYWSSLEWNGKYTFFKSILFGILILF